MFSRGFLKIIFIFILFFGFQFQAQGAWNNQVFQTGILAGSGWTLNTGSGASVECLPSASVVSPGPAINTTAGQLNDVNVGIGSNYALQLFSGLGDSNNGDWARAYQSDTVQGGGNSTLSFWFAGVFEDYHFLNHEPNDDAFLQINIIVGVNTVASLIYNWTNNFSQIITDGVPPNGNNTPCNLNYGSETFDWGYVPWTNYMINLSGYVGQTVTLQATVYDCSLNGHYGVGYLDNVSWVASTPSQVTLTKSSNPSGFVAGGPISYTLSYSNPASSAVAGVEINDTIPTGTTLVPGSISSNPSMPITNLVGNDLIWNINYLAANTSGTLSFSVMPSNCPAAVTNVAQETDLSGGNITSNNVINTIATCTPSPTPTLTNTPTNTNTPTISPTPSNTATVTATFTPTNSSTPTPTYTPTCVTYVWPDPYNPKTAVGGTLRFSCMNDQTDVLIYTVSGELVQILNYQTNQSPPVPCQSGNMWGTSYCWNGRNSFNFPVATGIYLYVVKQGNQVVMRGKFLLMNGP